MGRQVTGRPPVPVGMTASKLRFVAEYVDALDFLASRYLEMERKSEGRRAPGVLVEFVTGKQVRADLLAWADALEAAGAP